MTGVSSEITKNGTNIVAAIRLVRRVISRAQPSRLASAPPKNSKTKISKTILTTRVNGIVNQSLICRDNTPTHAQYRLHHRGHVSRGCDYGHCNMDISADQVDLGVV